VDKTDLDIDMLGAARATGAPFDGGGVVFEDDCGLLLLVVQITQHTTKPYHVLRTTRSSDIFCLCSGQRDAALLLARLVHKIFTEVMQRARCQFAVDSPPQSASEYAMSDAMSVYSPVSPSTRPLPRVQDR
jgi:hypothetical protein